MNGKSKPGPGTTERPILFNGAMVRAILEGRKTVTRRPVKGGQIPTVCRDEKDPAFRWSAIGQHDRRYGFNVFGATERECARQLAEYGRCPYGRPGDRLWVRETWQGPLVDDNERCADPSWWKDMSRYQNSAHCAYQASGDSCEFVDPDGDIPHHWTIYLAGLCIGQGGERYMKSQEIAPAGIYLAEHLSDVIEACYRDLCDGCNPKHLVASGWIAIPNTVSLSEAQADQIFDLAGAWPQHRSTISLS
jgi:hypothetical protein